MASRARAERGLEGPWAGGDRSFRLNLGPFRIETALRRGKRGAARAEPVPTRYKEERANI